MTDMEVILEQIFGETSQENAKSPSIENICSANKEVLVFDSAMAAMEVDSEQTFGKTTYENAKTPTMQRHFIESLSMELKLSPAVEAVALSAVRRRETATTEDAVEAVEAYRKYITE
nr:hypothetical protein Iba_chr11aCG9580 [Ipomoea batatas]